MRKRKVKMKSFLLSLLIVSITSICMQAAATDDSSNIEHQVNLGDDSASTLAAARFDESQPERVVASRWQADVFLPCRIIGLDEEHTVSGYTRTRKGLPISSTQTRARARVLSLEQTQETHSSVCVCYGCERDYDKWIVGASVAVKVAQSAYWRVIDSFLLRARRGNLQICRCV